MKRVSVIIPNYNYGKHLGQAIESILASDFDPGLLEIIFIDDASTDDSLQKMDAFIKEGRIEIRLICNPVNLGLVRCRNLGIVAARSELLFFLDPDNYIGPRCLAKHAETMTGNPDLAACYAPVQRFDHETSEFTSLISNDVFDDQKLARGNYIDAMAMFRKADLMEAGMYDLRMPPYGWEDYELWLRFASLNKKVRFIGGDPLSFYRSHPQSMSAVIDDNSYNLIKIYLNIKYNIELELFMTPELERMVAPKQGLPVQEAMPEPVTKQPEKPGFLSSIFRAYRKAR